MPNAAADGERVRFVGSTSSYGENVYTVHVVFRYYST